MRHALYRAASFAFNQGRSLREGPAPPLPGPAPAGGEPFAVRATGVSPRQENGSMGVVVHAFYPDVFREAIDLLNLLPRGPHLYVTTPPERAEAISSCLEISRHPHVLMICQNRGKDVLPFLKVAPLLIENGHPCFLKVHTKKSPHRRYGFFWRHDLYSKLMTPDAVAAAVAAFETDPRIGIIAPRHHLAPMTHYSSAIQERILALAKQVGVSKDVVLDLQFAAGTMFFARTECVVPLLDLSLEDEDFESERGQIDGTLAHAMERVFSVAAASLSLRVVDTEFARRVAAATPPRTASLPSGEERPEARAVGSGRTIAN